MPHVIDLTGQRFGRWTVLCRAPSKKKMTAWECRCECGTVRDVLAVHLCAGNTVSCGCYKTENSRIRATKHGKRWTRLYYVWTSLKQRCSNPNNKSYKDYGKRGITRCASWDSFSEFEAWAMSHGYAPGLTIERVDVNKGYDPENCTWIPRCEQGKNTTRTLNNRNRKD